MQIKFTIDSPDINEQHHLGESIHDYVLRLAEEKSRCILAKQCNAIVIGSDQALDLDGKILGKPENHENAKQQLLAMSGKTVTFYTGICVINGTSNEIEKDVILYQVSFRELHESDIENYLNKEQSYDCAGSFKSEALGVSLINKMAGDDPTALIGLPLIRLCEMLRQQGIKLP